MPKVSEALNVKSWCVIVVMCVRERMISSRGYKTFLEELKIRKKIKFVMMHEPTQKCENNASYF